MPLRARPALAGRSHVGRENPPFLCERVRRSVRGVVRPRSRVRRRLLRRNGPRCVPPPTNRLVHNAPHVPMRSGQ